MSQVAGVSTVRKLLGGGKRREGSEIGGGTERRKRWGEVKE